MNLGYRSTCVWWWSTWREEIVRRYWRTSAGLCPSISLGKFTVESRRKCFDLNKLNRRFHVKDLKNIPLTMLCPKVCEILVNKIWLILCICLWSDTILVARLNVHIGEKENATNRLWRRQFWKENVTKDHEKENATKRFWKENATKRLWKRKCGKEIVKRKCDKEIVEKKMWQRKCE